MSEFPGPTINKYNNMRHFNKDEFWQQVDNLTEEEKQSLIEKMGGEKLLKWKLANKRSSAGKYGLQVELSILEYAALLEEAGITAVDVYKGGYNLARINDVGNYLRKSCRFIPALENMKEKKISERHVISARENFSKTRSKLETDAEFVRRRSETSKAEMQKRMITDPNYQKICGDIFAEKYRGSIWINNGEVAFRILKDEPIPSGFKRGRKLF